MPMSCHTLFGAESIFIPCSLAVAKCVVQPAAAAADDDNDEPRSNLVVVLIGSCCLAAMPD